MASKYVDVSATVNGDGTLSTPAASAGAAGAWNDFAAAFTGTPAYGTVAAGDVIHVRASKDSGGLGYSMLAALTSTAVGTLAAPITFAIDSAGEVWVGDVGQFTVLSTITTDNYDFRCSRYCFVQASSANGFVLEASLTANGAYKNISTLGDSNHHRNWLIRSAATVNNSTTFITTGAGLYENFYFDVRGLWCSTTYGILVKTFNASYNRGKMVNLTIDFTNLPKALTSSALINVGTYSNTLEIDGFRVIGGIDSLYGFILTGSASRFVVRNAKVVHKQNIMPLEYANLNVNAQGYVQGFNGDTLDSFEFTRAANSEWRASGFHPTLNATLPTGAPWSYRIEPSQNVGQGEPGRICDLLQFYKSASLSRTVVVELLLPTDYVSSSTNDFYFTVSYTDTTGNMRVESSRAGVGNGVPIVASGAVWTYTALYPEGSYDPFKLSLTTAYPILQNTAVYVTVYLARVRVTSADSLFVDPAFALV